MSFLEILLLAVGLSMDSLAVSVTSGAVMKECSVRRVVKIAFVLAFFQAMFTLVGYLLGFSFLRTLCGLGIATSIDALAVGVSLAIMQTSLSVITWTIGIVTFLFSSFGVCFGAKVGNKVDLKLDLIGGVILIGIGVKILIEHLLGF